MGLREQAQLDARAILEDSSGFAWPVTLISPLGVITSLRGFTTDVGQTIDPETGLAVAGRRASFAVARAALPALPEAVAESNRKPWVAVFTDSQGVIGTWKVIEVLPDAAAGVVVLLLEIYLRAIVTLTGALALPSLQLAGSVAPRVALVGALALPPLQLAGSVAPRVSLAGTLTLPSLQLAGSITPRVSLAGALALPSLQLAGTIRPRVSLAGALALPSLQLAGTLTVQASPASAWLRLEGSTITGSGYSSVRDVFNPANPAVQATDARRPVNGTSANGLPIATFTDDFLQWPLVAANNGATKWGLALWIKLANTTGNKQLATITTTPGGASANKINPFVQSTQIRVDDQTTDRHATSGTLDTGWHFVTFEVDCTQATEALKVLESIDAVLQTVTFNSDTAWGASLGTPTGNMLIGGSTLAPASPFVGIKGPNWWFLARQLTAAERAAYKNFEAPT